MDQGKQRTLAFLKTQVIAVLATIDPQGKPQAATIYFAFDDDLTFYFITKINTRKYLNLQHNPNIALTIGTHNIPVNLQVEGKAEEIQEYDKKLLALDKVAKNSTIGHYSPPLNKLPDSEIAVYKITPALVRFLDQTDPSGKYNKPTQILP